jgi:tetratricopeptide (TPR) repeat protein
LPIYFSRLISVLLLACAVPGRAQDDALEQRLFREQRWSELAGLLSSLANRSADQEYEYGMALAQQQRWDDARAAFLRGASLQPRDKRFPVELAGIAFKQQNSKQAIAYLRRALRLDPRDDYANDFLATLYFLQGNLEAAVKYWNRVHPAKPQIAELRADPPLRLRPDILDHALAFSATSTLNLDQLRASEARLHNLEIFPSWRVNLVAQSDNGFDSVLRAHELSGFGQTKVEALLHTFSGLPFQEVTPEYYNLRGTATNITALARWDSEKRRYGFDFSGLLGRDPRWRYSVTGDYRNENWDVRNGFSGVTPVLASLNLRREAVTAAISRLVGWRWKWTLAAELSHRDFRSVAAVAPLAPELLAHGFQLKQKAQISYEILRSPDRRIDLSSTASTQAARLWTVQDQSFAKLQGSLQGHWFPLARGDDFETFWRAGGGKTFGDLSFDELFMLGLERDNDPALWMRAQVGTHHGRKGNAPLGRDYFVSNWETDKNLYSNGLITLKLAPLLDTGKITDPNAALGARRWLVDTGAEAKVKVLGVGAAFIYGKDLRTGDNTFYVTLTH